jgi:hypothetical protein
VITEINPQSVTLSENVSPDPFSLTFKACFTWQVTFNILIEVFITHKLFMRFLRYMHKVLLYYTDNKTRRKSENSKTGENR